MKWVTRKMLRVNRAATCWLIKRFIDKDAEFIFVEPNEVAGVQEREGAKGFDAPGATYAHRDANNRIAFENLVAEHCPNDKALAAMAKIAHAADVAGEGNTVPEAAGIRAISMGFPFVGKDDHDIVEKSAFMYDALYATLARQNK
jgi:hypothetical protein